MNPNEVILGSFFKNSEVAGTVNEIIRAILSASLTLDTEKDIREYLLHKATVESIQLHNSICVYRELMNIVLG